MNRKELLKAIRAAKEVLVSVRFTQHDAKLVRITKQEACDIIKNWPQQDTTLFESMVCDDSTVLIG